ncbi:FHA domain-containing protein DDL [Quillaja saponaria]|uniref:FHA domain-containing protein DDL n=1 Tax=Quillaja saponaria TaxID=32244 RepID=A0AAD7LM74_QUISA|nr:FHA domain-containing protein DDL [Quillaja saponaria]
MGRNTSNHSESPPIRVTGSSSHRRRSPPSSSRRERDRDRERSPSRRNRNSHSHRADTSLARDRSSSPPPPPREKQHHSSRGSAKMVKEVSGSPPPSSRSPSPRTKRLRRAQVDTGNERNHGSGSGRDRDRIRVLVPLIVPIPRELSRQGELKVIGNIIMKMRGLMAVAGIGKEERVQIEKFGMRERIRDCLEGMKIMITSLIIAGAGLQYQDTSALLILQIVSTMAEAGTDLRLLYHRMMRCLVTNSRGAERRNDENDSIAKMEATQEALEEKQKQKPSFELSGKLAAETNRVKGVTLLFNEPPDARKPDIRWRLYVFKAGEVLNEPLYIHRQSCYLFGRERRVADIPTDHPSCSKQHAVIQFRQVEKEQPDGYIVKFGRPYLMDLGSTNKTFLNDNPIEPQRYYELREKDTIKFGNSSREYVLLHENSAQ